jgi:hypothetical protein
MNPELPIRFSMMDEVPRESLAYPRFRAVLIGYFALLAALLAFVGIYSVVSYLSSAACCRRVHACAPAPALSWMPPPRPA